MDRQMANAGRMGTSGRADSDKAITCLCGYRLTVNWYSTARDPRMRLYQMSQQCSNEEQTNVTTRRSPTSPFSRRPLICICRMIDSQASTNQVPVKLTR